MSLEDFYVLLQSVGIPVAYRNWEDKKKPKLPYIIYSVEEKENFAADNSVYFTQKKMNVTIHTNLKNIPLENKLESLFNSSKFEWDAFERYNEEEKMYEVFYELTI